VVHSTDYNNYTILYYFRMLIGHGIHHFPEDHSHMGLGASCDAPLWVLGFSWRACLVSNYGSSGVFVQCSLKSKLLVVQFVWSTAMTPVH
jgi:hypothetical protein